jgi:hypothetical protein
MIVRITDPQNKLDIAAEVGVRIALGQANELEVPRPIWGLSNW